MKYFDLIPNVTFDDGTVAKNLNYKFKLQTLSDDYVMTYRIKDGECLESICKDLYDDASLWWVLSTINDIRDVIFDLPITEETIQRFTKDMSTENNVLNMTAFAENYDMLVAENDEKRTIKVIKPNLMQQIVKQIIRQVS